ncbi:glycosyltransferase, partial [Serratia marcescens]|uniref:glycosyltransferase n=8 Tax=Serratia TaxID=613 RepID=UPI0027E4B405
MKKIIYITLIDLGEKSSGVAKKIISQCGSMLELGYDVDVAYLKEEEVIIKNVTSDCFDCYPLNKWNKLFFFATVMRIIKSKGGGYDYAYIRLPYPSLKVISFPVVYLMKENYSGNLVLEIPTYPFLNESKGIKSKLYNLYLSLTSLLLSKKIDAISYMGPKRESIWRVKAIRVFNSVPLANVPVKSREAHSGVNFIGVAQLAYWHGYDRLIEGVAVYNKSAKIPVSFHIVGNSLSSKDDEFLRLQAIAEKNGVSDHIVFHGAMHGEQLDMLYNKMDIAVDSLGRHRSGNDYNCSIKSKEYCARGIPFIKSHYDDSFNGTDYYFQCESADGPVDVSAVIEWFKAADFSEFELREYAEKT